MNKLLNAIFGEPVFTYTRQQAIDDGVLVEIDPRESRRFGIKIHSVMTPALAGKLDVEPMLLTFWQFVSREHPEVVGGHIFDRVDLQCGGTKFYCVIGPDDSGEPCLTFMLPEED